MMLGIRQSGGEKRQTWSAMVVAFFAPFSQIGAMVLLISPEQIELESCACAQIEARGEGNRWVYGIRYLGFIRKAGYCNIKKSLPFWSWFWIVLPFHHPNQPYYRDEGFCYTTDFLLALWVILGETNYMTHSFIQLVPFLCKFLIVMGMQYAHLWHRWGK